MRQLSSRPLLYPSTTRLCCLIALATERTPLSSLQPGDALTGRITAHHQRKLFLEVPVVRPASRGGEQSCDAFLSLPASHELLQNPSANYGRSIDVIVRRVQASSARLEVSLKRAQQPRRSLPSGILSKRARVEAARGDASWQRLEDLAVGDALDAKVASVQPFGAFVQVCVSRKGPGGQRKPVEKALVPSDQQPGYPTAPQYEVGQPLSVRVLRPHPGAGQLLLTARPLDATALNQILQERGATRKRNSRRPSLAALAAAAGSQREGVVTKVTDFGAVVNVGARRPGLIHISQFDPKGPGGGRFVADANEIVSVGDRVLCKILPRSNERRLALRLLKVFPRSAEEKDAQRAVLRRGETLLPSFARVEDAAMGAGGAAVARAAAMDAAEMDAAWASRELEDDGSQPQQEEEEEEDPFAWAAGPASASSEEAAEPEVAARADPWAWAAADDATQSSDEAEDEDEDGPEWGDQAYFEDKYDIDTY